MICRILFLFAVIFSALFHLTVYGNGSVRLDVQFPYSLNGEKHKVIPAGSTQILFLNIESIDLPKEETANIKVTLPSGIHALKMEGWNTAKDNVITAKWKLPANYGQVFSVVSLSCDKDLKEGNYAISVEIRYDGKEYIQKVDFSIGKSEASAAGVSEEKENSTWYIQRIVAPVDEDGKVDQREAKDILYVRDVTLENIRNRLIGSKPADWPSLLNTPAAYILLEMRNPNKDTRTLHFVAELMDRPSGEVKKGLISVRTEDGGIGWSDENTDATEASIGLLPQVSQPVIMPLYINPFTINEGNYNLRITLTDGNTSKVTEVPLTIVKRKSTEIFAIGFAGACVAFVMASFKKLKKCTIRIGARGDITVALFAALAFGGVVVPVTLLGDFFHVILGPFSGLITGVLNGIVQYLLLMALLILFRRPGVLSLFFLMRWLLSAILFGRVTLVGILICSVSIVVLEFVLWVWGFFKKEVITEQYAILIAVMIGIADAFITFINMQQMMFFYRLYYANWFIALYMLVNGILYSSIGAWMGYRMGEKLKQVMGT